jgi:hypothetical protein
VLPVVPLHPDLPKSPGSRQTARDDAREASNCSGSSRIGETLIPHASLSPLRHPARQP